MKKDMNDKMESMVSDMEEFKKWKEAKENGTLYPPPPPEETEVVRKKSKVKGVTFAEVDEIKEIPIEGMCKNKGSKICNPTYS